jgi:hypothetical protein
MENDITKQGKGQIFQIGMQLYYIEICFFNGMPNDTFTGFRDEIYIPMNIVNELVIKESLSKWWTSGHIVLQNDFQFLEKGSTFKTNTGEKKRLKNIIVDRPDGRNKFCIRLYPVQSNSSNTTIDTNINRDEFEICYDFVVYDVKDIPTNNSEKKYKKYFLWDERFQLFEERNLELSTALFSKKLLQIESFNSDLERTLPPNIALKEIIKQASLYPDDSEIKIGYSDEGTIKKPDYFIGDIRDDEWDPGPTDESSNNKIFYTSPSNSNVNDDIDYMLPFCQSSDGYPVILETGRRTDDKRFKLKSLKSLFDLAESNQKERLYLFDTKDADVNVLGNSIWQPRGVDGVPKDSSQLINFTSGYASKVTSYYFCPMSNVDDMNFSTRPLHTFDPSTGEFNIAFSPNTIEEFFEHTKEMCSGLHNSERGQVLLKMNKIKQESGMIKNLNTPLSFGPKNIPLIQMLKDFVFLNQALIFETQGLTFRRPGIFFTLESVHSGPEQNDFWDKFLGQWMIVEIEHKFTQVAYTNLVTANKVNAFSKIYEEKDSEYTA